MIGSRGLSRLRMLHPDGLDTEVMAMRKVATLKIAALVPPALAVAVLLLFAVGETVSGDWSGLGHVLQVLPIVLLMRLGRKRPLWGGILLLMLGFIAAHSFADDLREPGWLAPFLIIIAPLLLSGILFLGAAGLEKRAA
jgi:hypothetical protein